MVLKASPNGYIFARLEVGTVESLGVIRIDSTKLILKSDVIEDVASMLLMAFLNKYDTQDILCATSTLPEGKMYILH